MKFQELQSKTTQELETQLRELKGELHGLRFRASEGQLKNVRDIRKRRKTIAQILTRIRQVSATVTTSAVVS